MWTTQRTVLAAFVVVFGCYSVIAADDSTEWDTDYARIRETAVAKDRPILLSVGSASCVWCTKLHGTTFQDRGVVALLDSGFVTGKIDAARYPELVRALRIRSYPTLVIAAPDGTILHTVAGYQTADEMTQTLRQAREMLRIHREKAILTSGSRAK